MKHCLYLIVISISCIGLSAQDVVIKNVNLIDVRLGEVHEARDVIIKDGIIHGIQASDDKHYPDEIHGEGKFLIPGLIDAHIHLFQSGGLYTRPDAFDARSVRPYTDERQWLSDNAEQILNRYLSKGITSVIDIGGPMYQFRLRDSLNRQSNTAHVYLTGPLISTYLPPALDVSSPPIIKVQTPEEAIQLVREQVAAGTDFIKIWYIALRPQDAIDNYPIIEATVKEAKLNHLPVAVHATDLATAKLALTAGADFLVHSVVDVIIDDEFIAMLKSSGAVYCPTLEVSTNYDKVFFSDFDISDIDFEIAPPIPLGTVMDLNHLQGIEDLDYYQRNKAAIQSGNQQRDQRQVENLKIVHDNQLPIALGTDAGNIGTMHVSSFFKEVQAMKAAGMDEAAILKSATLNAAKTIGMEDQIGTVDIGKRADLVVLNDNPLIDIRALESIDLILKKGTPIEPESLLTNTPEQLVQQQLNGYNGHNLEAFLVPYADTVKIFEFPNKLIMSGKKEMRDKYDWIEKAPDLHCELANRIVKGHIVIDYEKVIFDASKAPIEAIAIYKVSGNKIVEVTFLD